MRGTLTQCGFFVSDESKKYWLPAYTWVTFQNMTCIAIHAPFFFGNKQMIITSRLQNTFYRNATEIYRINLIELLQRQYHLLLNDTVISNCEVFIHSLFHSHRMKIEWHFYYFLMVQLKPIGPLKLEAIDGSVDVGLKQ